jgi:ketosteroid isomerase-like protein
VSGAAARALLETFRNGDEATLRRSLHPDVEVRDPERTGPSPLRGRDEFVAFVREWVGMWDRYELDLEAAVVAGGGKVVALVRYRGMARASGIPLDQRGAQVLELRDGLLTHLRPYTDRAEALRAAGLEEPERWMSAIERVRTGYEAWNSRDYEAVMALLEGAEFVPVSHGPDAAPFTERPDATRFWDSLVATWETFAFTALAFEPAGDRLLVEVEVAAKGRASGIELQDRWAHLYTLRDRDLVRLQAFTSCDEARAALLS